MDSDDSSSDSDSDSEDQIAPPKLAPAPEYNFNDLLNDTKKEVKEEASIGNEKLFSY